MSNNTGIIYFTEDAAQRAKRSVYEPDRWEIVKFDLIETSE